MARKGCAGGTWLLGHQGLTWWQAAIEEDGHSSQGTLEMGIPDPVAWDRLKGNVVAASSWLELRFQSRIRTAKASLSLSLS